MALIKRWHDIQKDRFMAISAVQKRKDVNGEVKQVNYLQVVSDAATQDPTDQPDQGGKVYSQNEAQSIVSLMNFADTWHVYEICSEIDPVLTDYALCTYAELYHKLLFRHMTAKTTTANEGDAFIRQVQKLVRRTTGFIEFKATQVQADVD